MKQVGRNPKLRVSYDSDAQYLLRLKQAVEHDKLRSVSWRSGVMTQLQELIESFISAPNPMVQEPAMSMPKDGNSGNS